MSKKVEVINYGEVLSQVSDFISSTLNSKFIITLLTSWPLAVVIIVLLLREGILDKLRELESLNYKDGDLKFIRNTLNEVKAYQTLSIEDNVEEQVTEAEPEEDDNDLIFYNPSAAVSQYWIKVESKVNEAYNSFIEREIKKGSELIKNPHIINKVKFLVDRGRMRRDLGKSISGLYRIKRKVARGVSIGEVETTEYITLCRIVVNEINKFQRLNQK
ncbi:MULTISPECIES: hypothetical protein [Bacillus]|uniref:hypothetical protein n=1 Tax=Bacillus TaxID=1386 RepID=UPI002867D41E|nr:MULTISPECIES: hypothetical protein [Bacillus]MEC1562496.1 hypothetical protein [Bacillus haynesii]WMW46610.1 hypothetical protein RFN66_18590 [Bacillus paralicheniformis]WMW48099.1 hypothetical protein RFN66_03660 [Bacillus paralicheniformis]